MKEKSFYPVILQTIPPAILTEKEVLAKIPRMKVTHIAATLPRPENGR